MDIKEKITETVEKITKDDKLQAQFKKDPVKTVEKVVGVDIPDDVVEKIVEGVKGFTGAQVEAPDLRAGAALVMAGLAAEGYTTVSEIEYIERGYENFVEKLRLLGANIEQVDSEKEAQKFKLRVG